MTYSLGSLVEDVVAEYEHGTLAGPLATSDGVEVGSASLAS